MIRPDAFDTIPDPVVKLLRELENWAVHDIAKRLAANDGITRTADYQLNRLREVRAFDTDYRERLKQLTAALPIEIDAVFARAAEEAHTWDKALYDAKGIPFVPLERNRPLQQLIRAASAQYRQEIGTLTNSRALKMLTEQGIARPLPQFFSETLDNMTFQTASGMTSHSEAMRRAVVSMADSGIRVARYESPGKRPVNRRIEGVVRANILTAINNMAAAVAMDNMDRLGVDHVLTSAHAAARPDHIPWQGRVFHFPKEMREAVRSGGYEIAPGDGNGEYPDLIAATRYTYADGLRGPNCRHDFGGFDPKYSRNPYTDEYLQSLADAENSARPFETKDRQGNAIELRLTPSEARQEMRRRERDMRATRARAAALKEAGLTDQYSAQKARYRAQRKEYRRFCDAMETQPDWSRVTIDMLGRI